MTHDGDVTCSGCSASYKKSFEIASVFLKVETICDKMVCDAL